VVYRRDGQNEEFYLIICIVLNISPSLKTLEIGDTDRMGEDEAPIDRVFLDLKH
jgi:hypothetical protein